jgi:3-mercaptopyruvate sulfurtransferase SseA
VRRAELAEAVAAEKGASILTSEDGALAQIVAAELRAATGKDVRSLLGGNEAWKAAGFTVEKGGLGAEEGGDLPDKYALEPERRNALFREYLNWEVSLVERLTNDQDAKATFRLA